MVRNVIPYKWIIGGIALLIIIAGACYLWYQHDTAPYRKEAAKSTELIREWQKSQKVGTDREAERAAAQAPEESEIPTAEKPITETTPVTKDTEPTQAQNKTESSAGTIGMETAETADVQVSPFGFGPYPEIPDDYTSKVDWTLRDSPSAELLTRVLIKLWTEGEKNFRGGGTHKGKVYPWYHNTIYVKFHNYKNADGEIIRSGGIKMSGPRVNWSGVYFLNPPPHIQILELDSSGIDPYQYLNLR